MVSADRSFATVDGLAHVDPGQPGLVGTLTGR